MAGIALDHLVGGLEAHVGDVLDGESLMVSLLSGDQRGVGGEGEVNTGIRHKVGLELSEINVEGTIETKRGSDGRDNLKI